MDVAPLYLGPGMDRRKFERLLARLDTEGEREARRAIVKLQEGGADVLPLLCDTVVHDSRVRVRRWCAEALGVFASTQSERALKPTRGPGSGLRHVVH